MELTDSQIILKDSMAMEDKTVVTRLKEVDLFRPLLVILIIVYHAFIVYVGGWEPINGYVDIEFYKWIDIYSYSFVLEAFVFISGLIWGTQISRKGLASFKELVLKKFKRLLIPAWFWSVIYYFLIAEQKSPAYEIISGVGHLWFLVMLFWCFMAGWVFLKLKLNNVVVLALLTVSVFISHNPLPFEIPRAMYYMLPFWCGIMLGKQKMSRGLHLLSDIQSVVLLVGGGILAYVSARYIKMPEYDSVVGKLFSHGVTNMKHMLIALLDTIAIYSFFSNHSNTAKPCNIYMKIGTYGMGIYIFQQTVLQLLYYHTSVAGLVGPYLLPWVGISVALLLSYGLSVLFMNNSIGRVLLGA